MNPPTSTPHPTPPRTTAALAAATVAVTVTMLVLDLAWLGVLAKDFYDAALGALRSPAVYWPAAGLFYAFY
ncbi:MAG TPA: hypothetical protein DD490_31435, partial [Acidobacteria bacterium]|nr:hypothetical protein [Acidobacteriota bacterium]